MGGLALASAGRPVNREAHAAVPGVEWNLPGHRQAFRWQKDRLGHAINVRLQHARAGRNIAAVWLPAHPRRPPTDPALLSTEDLWLIPIHSSVLLHHFHLILT